MLKCLPYRAWLLIGLLLAHAISLFNPTDYGVLLLEHAPTAALMAFLVWIDRCKGPLSNTACTLIFSFLLLHVIGAHYLYTNVPYDAWSQRLFGVRISDMFGWQRNHYDRFVHFMFGVLMILPMLELVERFLKIRGSWAYIAAIAFLAVFSKLYELVEWVAAVFLAPEAIEQYNGQQGDMFDAQKDMALALAGSILSATVIAFITKRRHGDG